MAKYTVTRSCGHEETIALFGKHKNREWRLNIESEKLCSDCWQKQTTEQHAEENRKAAEEAKESGLPELEGSEKQIAWAETLRIQMLGSLEEMFINLADKEKRDALSKYDIAPEDIDAALKRIQTKTLASWWIDHRSLTDYEMAKLLLKEINIVKAEEAKPPKEIVLEAEAEATIRPEKLVTETPAEIRIIENTVEIIFPEKRDDFRFIVKERLKMKWSGSCWRRRLGIKTGAPEDRAAEAGHRLLAAGFVIRIFDPEIRERAIAGDYVPECTRWIMARTKGDYGGWFSISWDKEDDFYQAAKKLSGSRYDRPNVVVPSANFEEVLDFAKMYSFQLSPGAQRVIEEARRIKENAITVQIKEPEKEIKMRPLDKPPVLETPEDVGIDDEFRENEFEGDGDKMFNTFNVTSETLRDVLLDAFPNAEPAMVEIIAGEVYFYDEPLGEYLPKYGITITGKENYHRERLMEAARRMIEENGLWE